MYAQCVCLLSVCMYLCMYVLNTLHYSLRLWSIQNEVRSVLYETVSTKIDYCIGLIDY